AASATESRAIRAALYDANAPDLAIPDDATVESNRPISSTTSQWTELGPDQIQVQDNRVDHLKNKPVVNRPVPHTGTLRIRLSGNLVKRTMLLRDLDSEAVDGTLPPAGLDAGDIPFDSALPLANRILARHGQQPQRVNISYAGLDLSLRRGSLRRCSNRDGSITYLVFITGYQIVGRALGSYNSASMEMSAEGV